MYILKVHVYLTQDQDQDQDQYIYIYYLLNNAYPLQRGIQILNIDMKVMNTRQLGILYRETHLELYVIKHNIQGICRELW